MTSTRTHTREAALSWCTRTILELLLSINRVARRVAGSAESMVLLIQRGWPVYQLSTKNVDQAISSGACLSYMITSSHEQPTFFVPRSRIDACRLWDLLRCFFCQHVRKLRLGPIEQPRDTLIATPWRTASCFKVSTAVFWLSKGPTGEDSSQIHDISAAAGLRPAST